MSDYDDHWYDMRTDSDVFAESQAARDEWDAYHAAEYLAAEVDRRLAEEFPDDDDTASSASRQHYIDTGEYLRTGEAESA